MSRLPKWIVVIGGYVLACLIAGGVVYGWQLYTQDASAQAWAGMYAGVAAIFCSLSASSGS